MLPRDAAPDTAFALLQIRAPKTKGRAAKHQASHVDPPDIVQLLDFAFGSLRTRDSGLGLQVHSDDAVGCFKQDLASPDLMALLALTCHLFARVVQLGCSTALRILTLCADVGDG